MLKKATSEGLGGASTLRGVMRNRVIGDAFVLGNIELRWKPLYFKFLKQDCYLGLNGFYDFGITTKNIKLPSDLEATFNLSTIKNTIYTEDTFSDYFKPGKDKLHQSAGVSIMLVMNRNFVVAIDMGKSFKKQDGNFGLSIGLNYLF